MLTVPVNKTFGGTRRRSGMLSVLAVDLGEDGVPSAVKDHVRPAFHGRQEVGEVVLDFGQVHLIENREMRLLVL